MTETKITLGVQSGDVVASEATRPAFLSLRQHLEQCTATYCSDIREFALVLRISGSLWSFEGEGVQNVRLRRKDSYVTADYVMPESRWQGVPPAEIADYVARAVRETLAAMVAKLVRSKIAVDSTKLLEDVHRATTAFLAETDHQV
jgi:hypothetical protein